MIKRGINCGSGQRRFESVPGVIDWANVDCCSRPPDQVPDIICDVGKERMPFEDGSVDYVVLSHVIEHFGCNEAASMIAECYRVLKEGGSLIASVPDIKELAKRWLAGSIDDFIFNVNCHGAYMGLETDRHKWNYHQSSLEEWLRGQQQWLVVRRFDWRAIPGMDLARDFWICGAECIK